MTNGLFSLNLDEPYHRLSKPPIVEAVIHWQARPTKALDPEKLQEELSLQFPEFPQNVRMHAMEVSAKVSPWGDATTAQQQRLLGFRLVSDTGREVVQVFRDGVTYGVVKDYSHWDSFSEAARSVWTRFGELAAPNEIQRLGVRFINHFPTVTVGTLGDILQEPPTCPANLPLKEFVYQSSFDVPGYAYGVRVIKVVQAPGHGIPKTSGLFLDIEAFTTKPIANESNQIDEALTYLRWLKNKVFFSLLTRTAIESFA